MEEISTAQLPHRFIRLAGPAGMAGAILFTVLILLQSVLAPGFSHVTRPISALALQPYGWIQSVNFILFGILFTVFGLGLHTGVGRGSVAAPLLFVLSGIGFLFLGFVPLEPSGEWYVEPAGHTIGSFLSFLGAALAFMVISRSMAAEPRWQPMAGYTLATGILLFLLFFGFGAFAESRDAPLHPWMGVIQRVMAMAWLACTFVLGRTLRRVGREPRR